MKTLFRTAQKFRIKLAFYRTILPKNEDPEFSIGALVLDLETFEKLKQFSFFEIGEYNQDENGWVYEAVPKNRVLQNNPNLSIYFPDDVPWAEQERRNEYFDANSLLKINSMKQILELYRSLFR